MEKVVALVFDFLAVPNVKLELPRVFQKRPSSTSMFSVAFVFYFFIISGTVYDVINEPPSVGRRVDDHGISRPEPFMRRRVNGQYIMEGLAAGALVCVGALGYIFFLRLDNKPIASRIGISSKLSMGYYFMVAVSFLCITVSMFAIYIFMEMKL